MRALLLLCLLTIHGTAVAYDENVVDTIAFGSCIRQNNPVELWPGIIAAKPQVFLFLGDNVYADTDNAKEMRVAYKRLSDMRGFRALRGARTKILATWDDHDYGKNDGGSEWYAKEAARREFLHFFEPMVPKACTFHEGVYSDTIFGPEGKRVQILLLDTRYFRSPHVRPRPLPGGKKGPKYQSQSGPTITVLGEKQWAWLSEQLKKPAQVRLIGTSIQAIATEHRFEKWSVFPEERRRLFRTIRESGANGVILLSGDRHRGEISVLPAGKDDGPAYPLYDVTSSSLNQPVAAGPEGEPNSYRVGPLVDAANFGVVHIKWDAQPVTVSMELRVTGGVVFSRQSVALASLRVP